MNHDNNYNIESWCTFCNLTNNYQDIQLCNKCKLHLNITDSDILSDPKNREGRVISFGMSKRLIVITSSAFNRIKSGIIKRKKSITFCTNKNMRKVLLKKTLSDNKMCYKKNTICDVYVKYGIPHLDTVINMLEQSTSEKTNNLARLVRKLGKLGLMYSDKIPAYKEYVNTGKDLKNSVRIGQIENIIIDKTDYLQYLNKYSHDDALDMAAIEYIEEYGSDPVVSKYIDDVTTLNF